MKADRTTVNQPRDIEQQLEALIASANEAPDPSEAPAPATGESPIEGEFVDLIGGAFADQVQMLLDEAAAASAGPSDAVVSAEKIESSPEPVLNDPPVQEEEAILKQIDDMLAEAADQSIFGEFQSIDQIEQGADLLISDEAVIKPQHLDESPAAPSVAAAVSEVEESGLDGDFQSPDDLDRQEVPLSAAAQAVADELDEQAGESSIQGDMETLEQTLGQGPEASGQPDDQTMVEIEAVIAQAEAEAQADEQAEEDAQSRPLSAAAQVAASPDQSVSRASRGQLLVGLLAKLDWPLSGVSPSIRKLVGYLAIGHIALGAGMLAWAMLGLMGAAAVGSLAVLGIAAKVVGSIFRGGRGAADAAKSDQCTA